MEEKIIIQVSEIIRTELLKRGIIVSVSCKNTKNGVEFTSSDFQTTPVLFRRNYVRGFSIETEKENGIKEIDISLSVRFEYFDGGGNGLTLCHMTCFSDGDVVRLDSIIL